MFIKNVADAGVGGATVAGGISDNNAVNFYNFSKNS